MDDQRLRSAIAQWRDSLVSLSGRNRLINYRPTRSSTLEFTQHDSGSVFEIIRSPTLTFTKGTRPPEKESKVDAGGGPDEDLEAAVLDQIQDFNPDDFPDHLFADKTQRDVDKALRNLASASKRELLDKGLRVLYLALGELRWTEDSGDLRRSPLLLVPIELDSLGPRERMFMRSSDDDMAVNPALALRLAEDYGLTLPSLEEVLLLIEGEGINGAIDRFRTLDYPQGWEVRDFAALSTFMFAKEAMYRDLLDNENRVAASGLIQALSGASGDAGADYLFEPYGDQVIDEVAPPEVSPLVIDADASQRAAVQAAVEGKSFTLDGPPGTGKSQTIANMIAALIGEGKSVLFVSEKAVALDVVRDRLAERGLGPFLLELHSSKAARKEVALRLGEALAYRPVAPTGMSATKIEQLREARRALTEYVTAVNEVRSPLGASVHQVIGWLEQSSSAHVGPDYEGDALDLSPGTLAEIEALILSLERTWALGLEGQSSTWYGLREESSVAFLLSELRASLSELAPYASDYKVVRLSLAMEGISDLPDLQELLAAWHAQPQYQEDSWLDLASFSLVPDAIASYGGAVAQRAERLSVLEGLVGDNWQELPLEDATKLMAILTKVGDDLDALRESTRPELEAARLGKAHRMALLEQLRTGSAELAVAVGVEPPRTTEELSTLLVAINAILSAGPMLAAWIYDSQARTVLRDAVELAVVPRDVVQVGLLQA